MSISSYRSTLQRLTDQQASAQRAIADQKAKIFKLSVDVDRLRGEAGRTSSPSSRASKLRSATSKGRDLVAAEKRLGKLMTDKARLDARVTPAASALERAEQAEERKQEREARRRRSPGVAGPWAKSSGDWLGTTSLPAVRSPLVHSSLAVPPSPEPAPGRRSGRPNGPHLIRSRQEIEEAYRELWVEEGRRPYWSQVAGRLLVDERTLRRARLAFEVDAHAIRLHDGSGPDYQRD